MANGSNAHVAHACSRPRGYRPVGPRAAHADGNYQLGELDVEVRDGVAKLAGKDTIAGSTATMDRLFRGRAIASGGCAATDPLVAASLVTATNPARVLGLADRGEIARGKRADLVALLPELDVVRVYMAGAVVSNNSSRSQ